jgi:PAS domain S-box-containing protein
MAKKRAWYAYIAVGGVLLTAFVFVHSIRVGPLFNVVGLSAAVAMVVAVRMHHPGQRLPWYLLATGQVLFVGGDVITYNYERFFGTEPPFPSIGDLFYLSVYPFLVAGLLLLIRRRSPGRDRASLIDSLIVSVGVGAISWVWLLAPYVHDETLTIPQKLTAMGYPMMDLILFFVAVRLTVTGGRRPPAFYLLMTSVAVLFATDSIYGWIVLHGTYDNTTGLLEWGWGFFYLLAGAAALHPSMTVLDDPAPPQEIANPRRRLLLLAGASLTAPGVELYLSLSSKSFDVAVLTGCSGVLFVLVLVRLNGLMIDIGEYRRTERRLRETEAKYRSLVEGLPAVVYIAEFGKDAAWRYISPQIESVLGFTPQEWMSEAQLWRMRILEEDRDAALDAELRLLNGEKRMHCEYRILGKDGRVIWIREEAEALTDDADRVAYLQGVMYDVTEEKQSEQRLLKALETEKEATQRLRSLHEMQNSFLQAVSHDLRTPLTSILGCALTLENPQTNLDDADARDLMGRISSNARKLHRLLTDLLDLDRMTRNVVEPKRDLVDVTAVLARVLHESQDDGHPITLLGGDPVVANVDAAQVERIVENLVTNAVRYTPAGTRIWIGVAEVEKGVLLTVEDEGPGIEPELREAIFEPFRQGSETVEHSPGVGIGLSLVARFAAMHGGRAWVEGRAGGGASFRVYLPAPRSGPSDDPGLDAGEVREAAGVRRDQDPVRRKGRRGDDQVVGSPRRS